MKFITAKEIILCLEKQGLTQIQIAQLVGLSQSTVSLIRNDKRKEIKHSTYQAFLSLFMQTRGNNEAIVKKV